MTPTSGVRLLIPLRYHRGRITVQRRVSRRSENRLNMRDLQLQANPCNARWITRNEQVSGSSPLVGSLFSAYLSRILGKK
jgi:hypothetical protein